MNTDIAAVIPVYCPDNETERVIDSARARFKHVIVVNDGSPNEFQAFFDALKDKVHYLQHSQNQGKGAAIKSALKFCKSIDVNGALTIDADGQHLMEDVDKLVDFANTSPDTFALGVRNFSKNIPLRSKVGNELTLAVLRIFYGLTLSDSQTGLRYLPKHIFNDLISLPGDRYEFELQCLLQIQKKKLVIAQVPITTVYLDDNSSSHFRPIRDSIRIYGVFLKFSVSSLVCFALDIALFTILFALSHNIWLSTAVARVASGVTNFTINRNVVFNQQKTSGVLRPAIKYFCLWLAVLCVSAGLVEMFDDQSSVSFIVPIKILVDVILFLLNYKIQKHFVFR